MVTWVTARDCHTYHTVPWCIWSQRDFFNPYPISLQIHHHSSQTSNLQYLVFAYTTPTWKFYFGSMTVTVWATNTSSINSTTLKLSDEGNLILTAANSNTSSDGTILWQSFDDMTNTYIQGMHMGINTKTGARQVITSWRSPDDPAPGNTILLYCTTYLQVVTKIYQLFCKYKCCVA